MSFVKRLSCHRSHSMQPKQNVKQQQTNLNNEFQSRPDCIDLILAFNANKFKVLVQNAHY